VRGVAPRARREPAYGARRGRRHRRGDLRPHRAGGRRQRRARDRVVVRPRGLRLRLSRALLRRARRGGPGLRLGLHLCPCAGGPRGELVAGVSGGGLVLEYALSATTVAIGWSGYAVSALRGLGIDVPPEFTAAPGTRVVYMPEAIARGLHVLPGWAELVTVR